MNLSDRVFNEIEAFEKFQGDNVFYPLDNDLDGYFIFPGFCDVHVHFREPGFFYKESIRSGSLAAAHGGYTQVCTMPNLNPVPDSVESLNKQLDIIRKDSVVDIFPLAAITKGEKGLELSDMEALAPYVVAFSDDGRGVQSEELMLEAMKIAARYGKLIVAHCEDNSLLSGGCVHDGVYARNHGLKGISSASEWKQVERDIALAKKSGVKYHVCHVSTKESVELIRKAKAEGVDISCETAPHYLVLNDEMIEDSGRFKMNPPIRSEADRLALIEGIKDGTVEMIATDHAPHSAEEKSKGLSGSLNGVVGLETAFQVLYTKLVKEGIISLEKLIKLMSINPKKRFNLPIGRDFTVWNLNCQYKINPDCFYSKGRSTPFMGMNVYGSCELTIGNGKIIYKK